MRQASLRVLAAGLALVVLAGGCSIGPDWLNPLSKLSRRQKGPADLVQPKNHDPVPYATPRDSSADPVSLASKATPSADLHVATARLAERSGKIAEAEKHYQEALKIDAGHLDALVGSARLKDRQGQPDQAVRLYRQAILAHPNIASLHNDLALCLARQRKHQESMAEFDRAIALEPKKWLYRNNAAMVLVEMGDIRAAVNHLKAVQGESVAHYNVAYILQKKGDIEAARVHFAKALEKNPSLAEARVWLDRLATEPGSRAQPAPLVASQRTFGDASVTIMDGSNGPRFAEPSNSRLLPPVPMQRETSAPWNPAVEGRVAPLPPVSSVRPSPSGVSP